MILSNNDNDVKFSSCKNNKYPMLTIAKAITSPNMQQKLFFNSARSTPACWKTPLNAPSLLHFHIRVMTSATAKQSKFHLIV